MRNKLEKILGHYREFADIAWSEVTDKVHTVEEYHVALNGLTSAHVTSIINLVDKEVMKLQGEDDEIYGVGAGSNEKRGANLLRESQRAIIRSNDDN